MARVKTFVDGGDLFVGDLNAIEDDYEHAFAIKKRIIRQWAPLPSPLPSTGTPILLGENGANVAGTNQGGSLHGAPFYLDPADYGAGTRTVKLRLEATAVANGTTAVTWNVQLYPLGSISGSTGQLIANPGSAVSGTIAALVINAAGSFRAASSLFTCPAAGFYLLGFPLPSSPLPVAMEISAALDVCQV